MRRQRTAYLPSRQQIRQIEGVNALAIVVLTQCFAATVYAAQAVAVVDVSGEQAQRVQADVAAVLSTSSAVSLQALDVTAAFLADAAVLNAQCDVGTDACLLSLAALCGVQHTLSVSATGAHVTLRVATASTGAVHRRVLDAVKDEAAYNAQLREAFLALLAPDTVGTLASMHRKAATSPLTASCAVVRHLRRWSAFPPGHTWWKWCLLTAPNKCVAST